MTRKTVINKGHLCSVETCDAKDPAKAAASSRKQRFGITQEDYDLMLLRQNMTCGICKSSEPRARWDKFQVDHDHDSGQVRGLLCGPCNRMLGQGGDKSDVLQAGADYLKRWGK